MSDDVLFTDLQDIPLVSIITLTYNKFDHLYDTVDSVLNQDYPKIEYIISDDGSSNFPENELRDYLDKNLTKSIVSYKILRNETNRGIVKNINSAYRKSSGKYILNLSCSDIFFEKQTVSKIIDRFIRNDCKVLVTSRLVYKDGVGPLYLLPHFEERAIINRLDTHIKQYKAFILSEDYDMASGCAMYFNRNIIEELDYFDENYIMWEDGPFIEKYLWQYKLDFAFDIISIWYGKDGISSNSSEKGARILENDVINFITTRRVAHIDIFSEDEKRKILYQNGRIKYDKHLIHKYFIYIKYIKERIYYKWIKWKRDRRIEFDLIKINEILKEKREKIIFKKFLTD